MTTEQRSVSAQVARNPKKILREKSEVTGKMALRSQVKGGDAPRAALGDIGNLNSGVQSLQIENNRKGIVKKEIVPKPAVSTRTIHKANTDFAKPVRIARDVAPQVPPVARVAWEQPAAPSVLPVPAMELHPQEMIPPTPASPQVMDISADEQAYSRQTLPAVENIDAEDKDNPQLVSEYVAEIYQYMRGLEEKYAVRASYLKGPEVTGKMRAILVDWLCQVHHRFHLLQETLYLTVSLIDRFLSVHPVKRDKLQLVGVTAMWLASKYEEMFAPEVTDFVYITDNAYTTQQIRDMEQTVLKTLDFAIGKPICLHFLRRNSKAGQVDAQKHTLAKYLMELTITEYDMVHHKPSAIAAAALCLAMKVLDNTPWTRTLAHYSFYSEEELEPLMRKLAALVMKTETSKLTAIHSKYASSKFMKISLLPELKSELIQQLADLSEDK